MNSLHKAILALALAAAPVLTANAAEGVKLTQKSDRVTIEINGELFTEYWFQGNQHPATISKKKDGKVESVQLPTKHVYFWPVMGPGGISMTRGWPMNPEAKNEQQDHPHHRGLWYAHGDVNRIDFWSEEEKAGRIVHDQFLEMKSGPTEGLLRTSCKWVAPDGSVTCTDERVFRVYNRPNNERLFDFEITIKAPADKPIVMGDTKEGSMSIRVAESMRVATADKKVPGKGHIINSEGVENDTAWGKRAAWCDYNGPVQDKHLGVAIFDHPSNPVHPTYWHVRTYGLFSVNPFGIAEFEKKPVDKKNKEAAKPGDLTIPAGQSKTWKYRFYMHEGDEKAANVAGRYVEYTKRVQ